MLGHFRTRFGSILIAIIVGSIAFVFVFYGVFSPSLRTQESSSVGYVNGAPISTSEFNQELARRVEGMKKIMGDRFNEGDLERFGIRDMVFQDLVQRKVLLQDAQKRSLSPGDRQVRQNIVDKVVFHKDGRFDRIQYEAVLQANHLTTAGFENLVRQDLTTQNWFQYFGSLVEVTNEEVDQEFFKEENRRDFNYAYLPFDIGKKMIKITDLEIRDFLTDPAKLKLVRERFDNEKSATFKGKDFEAAKKTIAHEILSGSKSEQIHQAVQQFAQTLLKDFSNQAITKAKLKPYEIKFQSKKDAALDALYLPEAGNVSDQLQSIFATSNKSTAPQNMQNKPLTGILPEIYRLSTGVLIVHVTKAKYPKAEDLDNKRRATIKKTLIRNKESRLVGDVMKSLTDKAKIEKNPALFPKADKPQG